MTGLPLANTNVAAVAHCSICVNTKPTKLWSTATTMRPTSDGTICVCDTHAGLIDEKHSTIDNIMAAKRGEDASRRAT